MNTNKDPQLLRLLSIFHYLVAGISGLFSCTPMPYLIGGLFALALTVISIWNSLGIFPIPQDIYPFPQEDALMGIISGLAFVVPAGIMILIGWVFSICIALVGHNLALKKNYKFCLVMAGVECIFIPLGTVLGIFTIIVLMRHTIKALFAYRPVADIPMD